MKLLKKNAEKHFDWFSLNFLKANPDKCHLLTNIDNTTDYQNEKRIYP